jgi:stalled ribosome rescue protein Dom34
MSAYIVWLDHKEAQVYQLTPQGPKKEHLKKSMHEHSNSHADARHDQQDSKFYHEIAAKLSQANEILLIGPGLAKNHFKTHLEQHHHAQLAKKVVGVETVDHITEPQMLDVARKFFKSYDVFHS